MSVDMAAPRKHAQFAPKVVRIPPPEPPTCHWPIGRAVEVADSFRWPDVRHLCFVDPGEVRKYQEIYFWMTLAIEPILLRPQYRSTAGWRWPEIFQAFKIRNRHWNRVTTSKSLGSIFIKKRNKLQELVAEHNSRIQGKTLQERTARTMYFLTTPRSAVEGSDDKRALPLVHCQVVLHNVPIPPRPEVVVPAFNQAMLAYGNRGEQGKKGEGYGSDSGSDEDEEEEDEDDEEETEVEDEDEYDEEKWGPFAKRR